MTHSVSSLNILIRSQLKARGLSLEQVAKKLGSNHASLSRMLSGKSRMTIEDLSQLSRILGVPASILMREAETKSGPKRLPIEMEKLICGDPRRYVIFLSLNYLNTVESIAERFTISSKFVRETLAQFSEHGFVIEPKKDHFQISDQMVDISMGRTMEFYRMKADLYHLQALQTGDNLNAGADYWKDKDDQLAVIRLSKNQAEVLKQQLLALMRQAQNMEELNSSDEPDGQPVKKTDLHGFFLTLKPLPDVLLRELIHTRNDSPK